MANQVIPENYENMISALKTSAKDILEGVKEMLAASATCQSAVGEDDKGGQELVSQLQKVCVAYDDATDRAIAIADAMQDELDKAKAEEDVWSNDDISADEE